MGWILYGLTLGLAPLALLAWYREKEDRPVVVWRLVGRWSEVRRWLSGNYVPLIFSCAILVLIWAAGICLWRVPFLVGDLLTQLSIHSADPDKSRSIVTALAAVLAAIAIFGTIIVQSIRVWTNERQLTTIEQGHVTDRITKAVDQLGAEKTVKRPITDADGKTTTQETTEPNLEVRLGGLYALARIAHDSLRDHIPIMEILCAYIRLNAPATGASAAPVSGRADEVRKWLHTLPLPRIDIQTALTIVGRRDKSRLTSAKDRNRRLDISNSNLRRAYLNDSDLAGVKLFGSLLENASLVRSNLRGANLMRARFIGASLRYANLENASGSLADFRLAEVSQAKFINFKAAYSDLRFDGPHEKLVSSLASILGNPRTLLPAPDSQNPVPTFVWNNGKIPPGIRQLVEQGKIDDLLSHPDSTCWKTGTPLPHGAPYPAGHPLEKPRQ